MLDVPRDAAQALGLSSAHASAEGQYRDSRGQIIDFTAAVDRAVASKISLPQARTRSPLADCRHVSGVTRFRSRTKTKLMLTCQDGLPTTARSPESKCYDAAEETMATITRKLATEADLLAMPRDGHKYELVDGEIRVSPTGNRHGVVIALLSALLVNFVKPSRLGHVISGDAGFRLPGKNIRCPDVSFVAAGRFPDDKVPDDFGDLAPDLAVEVLSPHDRPRHVLDKIGEYLEAGVRLIWVIDPRHGRAVLYRSLSDVRELRADGTLDGEDVIPGFRCALRDILS